MAPCDDVGIQDSVIEFLVGQLVATLIERLHVPVLQVHVVMSVQRHFCLQLLTRRLCRL